MIEWILERLGIVIFLLIFVSQVIRAVLRSRKAATEHESQRDESAEARRVREIQEQIRRQIAQRRGGHAPVEEPPPATFSREQEERPVARPQTTQLPEMGGPLGRMLEELQKRAEAKTAPVPAAPPPVLRQAREAAEVERQGQIMEQLRVAEETRVITQRRAAHLAAERQHLAESEGALRSVARGELLHDLRDVHSLRRAFVLREVLGPPVALR